VITFTAPLKIWTFADGRVHFMSVPAELAGEIRAHAMMIRRGFGSVKVEVTVDDPSAGSGQAFTWRTSIFPSKDTGGYFLPVKIEVLRKTGIVPGDEVTVELKLL
jgi:hypothetical protein